MIPRPDTFEDTDGFTYIENLVTPLTRVIRVIHPDLFGRQRGKQFPVSMLPDLRAGIAYSKMSIAEDLFGCPVDESAFPQLAGHPDILARLDPHTAVVPPWEPDSIWVLASLWEGTARSALCARGQLADSISRLETTLGLSGVAAGEPEFYLFRSDKASSRPIPYSTEGVSYTIDRVTDPDGVIGRMHRQLIDFEIGVTAVNREFSPGQFEINLQHSDLMTAADRVFVLKNSLKELATIEGYQANFMAKPLTKEEGSSLHVHVSLWKDGVNAFQGKEGMSETLLGAIAGIQMHARALTAFSSPTVNSYKRLFGAGLSPNTASWGEDDRYAFVRIPAERGNATRLELRSGDASANPHLLLAAVIHAMRDGINRNLTPEGAGSSLPRNLGESLASLAEDVLLRDSFGDEFIDIFTALKKREVERFELAVTDWEWDTYHAQA